MVKRCAVLVMIGLCHALNAQIKKVEPPNWWVGMAAQNLQLLVYGDSISKYEPSIQHETVTLIEKVNAENPNYLFLEIQIPKHTVPGKLPIKFVHKNGDQFIHEYKLRKRAKEGDQYRGFGSSDVVYLITPDRFANENPNNDVFKDLLETEVDRTHDYKRHGGDIMGITAHLDYIDEMGFTAIWSSPLLINDMPEQSYHGYAITDFYEVDPRFGTLKEYIELSERASERGIKLIMDQVANHCGREHWWMDDLPFKDWVNFQNDFESGNPITNTNHRRTVNQDRYASEFDLKLMEQGWFVPSMPDLNQSNPFMAKYLIQNSIWWIETLQLGGIRQDTYPYPNKRFMSDWAIAIMKEYPNFNIVGEEWSYNPLLVGYWQEGANNRDGYESNLKSTMDFPIQKALVEALIEPESWDKGLIKLYEGLANDFYYANPQSILLFGDNHDMDRIFTQLNEDVALTKMAMAFILTAPRIPQLYYGTEILMQNSDKPGDHGLIRTDFPGGWADDEVNAFNGDGLSAKAKGMQSYLKKLLNFRKLSKAIHSGQTKHFAPKDGVYVLFRYNADELVMLILNKNQENITLDLTRYAEMNLAGKEGRNVLSDEVFVISNRVDVEAKSATLLSINRVK